VCVCVCVVTSHGAEVTGNTEFDLVSRGPKAVQHSSLRVFLLKNARSERYWYGDTLENEAEEELTLPDFCYNHLTKYKKTFLPLIFAGGITFYTTKLKSRYSANWFFFLWKFVCYARYKQTTGYFEWWGLLFLMEHILLILKRTD